MTKPEGTGLRASCLSGWIRNNCPDSKTGFLVSDIDFILINKQTKSMMCIEEKCFERNVDFWFHKNIKYIVATALNEWCKNNGWNFKGFNIIQFENTGPDDGKILYNGQIVTNDTLRKKLSMNENSV